MTNKAGAVAMKRPNIIRRIYDWVLHWADTPYGVPVLFMLAFAESSFFPIPPDVLLIALALSARKKAFRFALVCSIGSVLGGLFGYYIGYALFAAVADHIPGMESNAGRAMSWYKLYDVWVVGAAAFTPIPYKVFTILAGFAKLDLGNFMLASVLGRFGRFFLVSGMIYFFGARIRTFIEKYFNLCCFAFTALLIGAVAMLGLIGGEFTITESPEAIAIWVDDLASPDLIVRKTAHDQLIITTQNFFKYRPDGPATERAEAVARWRKWLEEWRQAPKSTEQ